MWQQIIPRELEQQTGNATLASTVYADPFTFALTYPVGTPERDAVIQGYRHVQRLLCIAGICLSVLLVAFSLVIRNPKLGKEQSLKHAEVGSIDSSVTNEGEKRGVWNWLKS